MCYYVSVVKNISPYVNLLLGALSYWVSLNLSMEKHKDKTKGSSAVGVGVDKRTN